MFHQQEDIFDEKVGCLTKKSVERYCSTLF